MTERGSSFGFESSLVIRRRVSIGHFLLRGMFIDLKGCSEVYMYFYFLSFYISLMYTGFVTIHWHTLYFIYIYIYMMYFFLHLSLHVLFLFSLYMPWWVLFKCFRKTGCESFPCHELSSCKVFQDFMLGLDLFCNSTSDYEFSGLRLLSWFICLLWFCHELPKEEIVRDIFM